MEDAMDENQVGLTLEADEDQRQYTNSPFQFILPSSNIENNIIQTQFEPNVSPTILPDTPSPSFRNMQKQRMLMDYRYAAKNGYSRYAEIEQRVNNTIYVGSQRSAKNVLLVDDSPVVIKVISRFIRNLGMIAYSAQNGREAVEFISQKGNDFFDIVLMDIDMPLMDGCEAVEIIVSRETATATKKRDIHGRGVHTRSRHLIAMTDYSSSTVKQRAFQAGFEYFIPKPITVDIIENFIRVCT